MIYFFVAISKEARKTRGPTVLADIWNLNEGQELEDHFNELNQCIDQGELKYFCGTIARNSKLTPLGVANWRQVPKPKKDAIWKIDLVHH